VLLHVSSSKSSTSSGIVTQYSSSGRGVSSDVQQCRSVNLQGIEVLLQKGGAVFSSFHCVTVAAEGACLLREGELLQCD
jgi:hypothetical protein